MIGSETLTVVRPDEGHHINFAAVGMDYKVRFDQVPSQTAVHEWTLGPHQLAAPPHKHDNEDEIFYVLEGEVTLMQDEDVTMVSAGSYALLPRGHFHTFWNATDAPARLIAILAPGQIEEYFEMASELVQPGQPPNLERLDQLVQQYGLTMRLDQIPELLAKYGLEIDVPLPPNSGTNDAR